MLATALGDGPASRLYQTLVVERGIATGAGAWYSGAGLELRPVSGSAYRPSPASPSPRLEDAVDAEIARLLEDGVTEEELERAKFGVRAFAVYSRDSLQTLARIFGAARTSGLTAAQVERWPEAAAAVTAAQAAAAGRAVLVPERSVTALLLPEAEDSP